MFLHPTTKLFQDIFKHFIHDESDEFMGLWAERL